MKRGSLFVLFLMLISGLTYGAKTIEEFIKTLPVSNIRIIEKESFYSSILEIMIEQPLDHKDPEAGSFLQKLYISHIDSSRPMVIVTEGYAANYYHTSEPAQVLKCNQIIVEHRFFGKSRPDSIDWQYLTMWQAASDYHRIIEMFKSFYRDKWVATGISKGGQTVMFHSYFYPNDVDVRIPYVAPLNHDTEDSRIYKFLDHVGSCKCRRKIHNFQEMALKNQETLRPAFKKFSDKHHYTYELAGGIEKAFEYCILEYSFAFWQWGYMDCKDIPKKINNSDKVISHMNRVAGFDYFSDKEIITNRPFFYQAYTEMGYYGYDLDEFSKYLKYVTEPGFEFTLPDKTKVTFNESLLPDLEHYIKYEAEDFIFIYGEYDTWSATAVELSGETNSKIFVKKKGSHRTRVSNMQEEQQDEFYTLLDEFLKD